MGAKTKLKNAGLVVNSNPFFVFLYYFAGLFVVFYVLKLLGFYEHAALYILIQSVMIATAIVVLHFVAMRKPGLKPGQKVVRFILVLVITLVIIVPLFRYVFDLIA